MVSFLFVLFAGLLGLFGAAVPTANAGNPSVWSLVWSDEFDGPNGSPVDSSKWSFDIGGNGWGNNELETYTSRTANADLEGGTLVIKTLKETLKGADGITRDYTSARLLTKTKFTQMYGRFEARIKIPYGQGIWPAFWMLGDNIDTALAQLRRDRHHGKHRQGAVDRSWHFSWTRLLGRERRKCGLHITQWPEVLRRFPHVCRRVGTERHAVLRRWTLVQDAHARGSSCGYYMGL